MILTILASWALASDPSAVQAAPATPPAKKERMVCRTMEMTGTRLGGGRVCKSESDWQKDKEDAERVLNGRRDLLDAAPARPAG
ncbi:MAG: hypothetical protein ACJ8FB_04820 [Sphingomicrobium sp.]|jgi:hypothetical protein